MPQAALASLLPSDEAVYVPERYAGPANPVGTPTVPSREVLPHVSRNPRVMHPKLNSSPWSYSYAQVPEDARPKRRRRRK